MALGLSPRTCARRLRVPTGKLLLMQLTTEGEVSGRINLHERTRPLPLRDAGERAMYPDSLISRLIDVRGIELNIR